MKRVMSYLASCAPTWLSTGLPIEKVWLGEIYMFIVLEKELIRATLPTLLEAVILSDMQLLLPRGLRCRASNG